MPSAYASAKGLEPLRALEGSAERGLKQKYSTRPIDQSKENTGHPSMGPSGLISSRHTANASRLEGEEAFLHEQNKGKGHARRRSTKVFDPTTPDRTNQMRTMVSDPTLSSMQKQPGSHLETLDGPYNTK